jgi:hypothetical protein
MSTTQTLLKPAQAGETPQSFPPQPDSPINGDLNMRLEKAMRRAELLGYAAAGLALAILAFIVVIAFVPK